MSAYLKRRVIARIVLGMAAIGFGFGFLAGFEAVAGHHPTSREFLYEPHPEGVAVRYAPPEDTFDFSVQVSARDLGAGLKPADFVVANTNSRDQFSVVRAEYIHRTSSRPMDGSAPIIAMLFDQSGSIATSDSQNLRIRAGQQFVDAMPSKASIAVFTFSEADEQSPADHPKAPFGATKEKLKQVIQDRTGRTHGSTPTFAALESVLAQMPLAPPNRNRVLLCFTDGGADDTQRAPLVEEAAKKAGVKIWFIGLGDGDSLENERIATATGGAVIPASAASQIAGAFAQLAHSVIEDDHSVYNVTIRANRERGRFRTGEMLTPVVGTRLGRTPAGTYAITVTKGARQP